MAGAAAAAIPTVASAIIGFDDLTTQAGAGPDTVAYLKARGIDRTPTLALVATTAEDFVKVVVQPFLNGVDVAGTRHKAADEVAPVVQAILTHCWMEARRQWELHSAPPTPVAPAAVAAPAPAPPPRVDERPPKLFPAWAAQVEAFNARLLGGQRRRFPTHVLLGAEEVLARMWHEHTTSKLYTPASLVEILARRTYQASGEVNPHAVRRASATTEEKEWTPRTLIAVLDGLESVRWLGSSSVWGRRRPSTSSPTGSPPRPGPGRR